MPGPTRSHRSSPSFPGGLSDTDPLVSLTGLRPGGAHRRLSGGGAMFYDVDGNTVRLMRGGRAWSREDLAAYSGVAERTLANIETKHQRISRDSLVNLAAAFDCSIKALVRPSDEFYEFMPDTVTADRLLAQATVSDRIHLASVSSSRAPIPELDVYPEGCALDADAHYLLTIDLDQKDTPCEVLVFQAEQGSFHLISTLYLSNGGNVFENQVRLPVAADLRARGMLFEPGECNFLAVIAPVQAKGPALATLTFVEATMQTPYLQLDERDLLLLAERIRHIADVAPVTLIRRPTAFVRHGRG